MRAEERQKRIAEHFRKVEFASLEELAIQVGVSVSTVRRDVIELESANFLRRIHGGARLVGGSQSDEFIFSVRNTHQLPEKEAIAKACSQLISPNQTVIVDAGSTLFHVARHLEPKTPQIFTNSLPIANHYMCANRLEVVLSGGVIYHKLGVLVGPLAVEAFAKIHVDVALMGAGGITEEGTTNSHGLLIDIQRAMIHAAQKVIFCLDHTKLGRKAVSFLCGLDDIDILVTDQKAPAELVAKLRAKGIEVMIAPSID